MTQLFLICSTFISLDDLSRCLSVRTLRKGLLYKRHGCFHYDLTCPYVCLYVPMMYSGVCVCKNGFSGQDCSTNDTAVPIMFYLPRQVFNTETLTCRTHMFPVINLYCFAYFSDQTHKSFIHILLD